MAICKHISFVRGAVQLAGRIAIVSCLSVPVPAAAQAVPPAPAAKPAQDDTSAPIRVLGYGGYAFSSIIRHGATVSFVFAKPRDSKSWAGGLLATVTAGQRGFAIGAGWAKASRENLPAALELRGVVGRPRTDTTKLLAKTWFAGAEATVVFLVIRVSAGIAFPVQESGWRDPMFLGSIGFTPPVFSHKWFK